MQDLMPSDFTHINRNCMESLGPAAVLCLELWMGAYLTERKKSSLQLHGHKTSKVYYYARANYKYLATL